MKLAAHQHLTKYKEKYFNFILLIFVALLIINDVLIYKNCNNKSSLSSSSSTNFKENLNDFYNDAASLDVLQNVNIKFKTNTFRTNYCSQEPINITGRIRIRNLPDNFSSTSNDVDLNLGNNYIKLEDGRWLPVNCRARHRVAIIIPYKDRQHNLNYFLHHMHPFLQRQELEYQIFVIEQVNNQLFNKGILMNSGFLEIMLFNSQRAELSKLDLKKTKFEFDCVIFHDVDLLPEDDRIMYSCPSNRPRHLSVAIDKFNYKIFYTKLIGGVLNFKTSHFIQVNGYSNKYWGWGGEDDDMETRLSQATKISFERPHIEIAHYTMLKHQPSPVNPKRRHLLKVAHTRYSKDGLNNVRYLVRNRTDFKLYTHFYVDVGDPPKNIFSDESNIIVDFSRDNSNSSINSTTIHFNSKNLTNLTK